MSAAAIGKTELPVGRRLAAHFTLAVLIAGCVVLWFGVPVLSVWLAGQLVDNAGYHLPLSLVLVVPGMFAVGVALAWVNNLWLRITGGEVVEVKGVPVQRRGPLEVILPVCGVVAVIALVVWFLFWAENPSVQFL
jgi:hypothetical protein